jgi:hypothetical protein
MHKGSSYSQYLTSCTTCGNPTSKQYARVHGGQCKRCAQPDAPVRDSRGERIASAEEQHARYIDCGPAAWDDRD